MHSRSVIQAFNALHWSPQGQVRCTRLCGVQEHVAWTRNSKHYAGSRDNGLITGQRQHLRRHSSVRASVHTRRPLKNGFLHLGQDKGKTSYCSVTQQLRFRQGSITRAISHSSKFCMAASNYGEIVEIKPKAEHTATIIFLHGLGEPQNLLNAAMTSFACVLAQADLKHESTKRVGADIESIPAAFILAIHQASTNCIVMERE